MTQQALAQLENLSLFADPADELSFLEQLPQNAKEKAYQEKLWTVVLLFKQRLNEQKIQNADHIAESLVAEIAMYLGGRSIYLPRGDKLQQELRDIKMFTEWFNGQKDINQLKEEFKNLNESQIYKVLRKHRKAFIAQRQQSLLED